MIRDWQSEFFLIKLNLLKLLADLNTSNQHNWNNIGVMLSLFTEFTTEYSKAPELPDTKTIIDITSDGPV